MSTAIEVETDSDRVPWTDRRTGLCSPPQPGPGPWPLADLVHRVRSRVHAPPSTVAGAGSDPGGATAACVGEALERYAAAVPRPADLVATTADLGADRIPHLAPESLGVPVADDVPLAWLYATDGRLVPRDAVGAPATAGQAEQRLPFPQGSTGLAAATDLGQPESSDGRRSERPQTGVMARRRSEDVLGRPSSDANAASAPVWGRAVGGYRWIQAEAEESAAAEVIERDTLVRAWRRRRLAPVPPEAVLARTTLDRTRAEGLQLVTHLLPTSPGEAQVPHVAVVGLRDPRRGLLGVGASYRPDRSLAATRAWREAVVSIAQAAELADPEHGPALCAAAGLPPWRADRRYAASGWAGVRDLAQHVQLLLDPDLAGRVWRRLDHSPPSAPAGARRTPAGRLVRELFPDVATVDLTPTDLAAQGVVVVRVLAVGARTVRPAGLDPEELPCPLT